MTEERHDDKPGRKIELSPELAQHILYQLGMYAFRCKLEVDTDRERGIPETFNGAKLGTVARLEDVQDACVRMREALSAQSSVATIEGDRLSQQCHILHRQAELLDEEGVHDVTAKVLREASTFLAAVWQERENYRTGMANWKRTAEAKDAARPAPIHSNGLDDIYTAAFNSTNGSAEQQHFAGLLGVAARSATAELPPNLEFTLRKCRAYVDAWDASDFSDSMDAALAVQNKAVLLHDIDIFLASYVDPSSTVKP